jgi:hypothetical protein
VAAVWAGSAAAQVDLVSADTIHGVVDLRAAAADGEPSFTQEGFGKLRYGGRASGDAGSHVQVAEAAIEWTPRLNWAWSAVIDAGYQPGQEQPIDLYQAYVLFKPVPRSTTQFRARAGYFYPPVSLEHDARVWGLTDTITPSAINSWAGEEVKVVGAEATLTHDFGDNQLTATGGVFGYDDTAGTLLTFRGWALHDLKSQATGGFDLPPLSHFDSMLQSSDSYSTREIDRRLGYYAKLEWRPPIPVTLEALYYDNAGDGVSVQGYLQWAWKTRFTDVGATAQLGPHTRLAAQAIDGSTMIGKASFPLAYVDFRAAYLRLTQDVGKGALTGRLDLFDTHDEAPFPPAPLSEHGWALTTAWRQPLTKTVDLRLEAIHVDSTRPERVLAGKAPRQRQNLVQSSLRFSF